MLNHSRQVTVQEPSPREAAEALFLEQLETIESVIRFFNNQAGFKDAHAEDFESYVKVRLIENDYGVIRSFERRCSFQTFLTIVVRRFLLDYRIHLWGRWHPSAEAKRLGDVAIELEKLIHRDSRPLEEALPVCRKIDATVTMHQLETIAARLPRRTVRARPVNLDEIAEEHLSVDAASVYETTEKREREAMARTTSAAVRDALNALPEDDRLLLRLRFSSGLSVIQIARIMNTDQKPLYRRIQRCLRDLRRRLERAGITSSAIAEVFSGGSSNLDFGFSEETNGARPSKSNTDLEVQAEDRIEKN